MMRKSLYLKESCGQKKRQTWKWRIMSRKWINYVDPYLTLFKQTIPLVGVTFLHMKQSFLTLFLQEKVDHKLFKPNVFHPQLIKYWKIKMCN